MSKALNGFTNFESLIVNKLTGNGDVAISVLFRTLYKRWPTEAETNRKQQQYVVAVTSRANRKLRKRGLRIVPGVKRGTYRMTKV
jgi:hypothetical protein